MAHERLAPGTAEVAIGEVTGASINRSPTAYLYNPKEERDLYRHDTDKNMTLLKLKGKDGDDLGMFNWFAVHPTSLNNTNRLVSGDNKGYASYLFEKYKNGPTSKVRPGQGKFVAAFASTNLGDVSPNIEGPRCIDTGLPCDLVHSTCDGFTEKCIASGPGKDMYESCEIIGRKQFEKAKQLYHEKGMRNVQSKQKTILDTVIGQKLNEMVNYVHTFVKMPGLEVRDKSGKLLGKLCKAALGDSFAAGTIDGPGMFDFTQGQTSNRFFEFIAGFLHHSTPEEKECQHPKGILLPTGR